MFSSTYQHGGFKFESTLKTDISIACDNTQEVSHALSKLTIGESIILGRGSRTPEANLILKTLYGVNSDNMISKKQCLITMQENGIQITNISANTPMYVVLPITKLHPPQPKTSLTREKSITLTEQERGALVFFSDYKVAFFQYAPNPKQASKAGSNTSWNMLTFPFEKLHEFMQRRSSK